LMLGQSYKTFHSETKPILGASFQVGVASW
jgi:hypothetical protein